jgi:hypothetical protein
MAVDNCEASGELEQLDEYPDLCLDWAYDEGSSPATLTLFDPRGSRLATAWITVDDDTGVSLEQAR